MQTFKVWFLPELNLQPVELYILWPKYADSFPAAMENRNQSESLNPLLKAPYLILSFVYIWS